MTKAHRGLDATSLALAVALGLGVLFWPWITSHGTSIPGGAGDTRFNHYLLEHHWQWLRGAPVHASYWSPPFFHPAHGVLAHSDTMAPAAVPYLALRALGFDPDGALLAWMALVTAVTAGGLWVAARRGLGLGAIPAATGAFLAVFSANRLHHVSQFQMLTHGLGLAAAALLAFSFVASTGWRRDLALVGAACCAAAQVWASFYLAWFLALLAACTLAAALLLREPRRALAGWAWARWRGLALAGMITLVVLAPLAKRYLAVLAEVGPRQYADTADARLGPSDWFHTGRASPIYRSVTFPLSANRPHGLGVVTLGLGIGGLVLLARRTPWALPVVLGAATVAFLTTQWPGDAIDPWRWVYGFVPGAQAIRIPFRSGVFLAPLVALGVAVCLDRIRSRVAVALLAVAIAAEQTIVVPSFSAPAAARRTEIIATAIPPGCASFFALTDRPPVANFGGAWQLDAMWAQITTGVPTVNGYSGVPPSGWRGLQQPIVLGPGNRETLRSRLEAWTDRHGLAPDSICWVDVDVSPAARSASVGSVAARQTP